MIKKKLFVNLKCGIEIKLSGLVHINFFKKKQRSQIAALHRHC